MLIRIAPVVACVGLSGCGFTATSQPTGPDAALASRGSDASNGPVATDCLSSWMSHTVTLHDPQPLSNQQSGGGDERDPWISKDGLRLYYTFQQLGRGNGNAGSTDIYLATRPDNQPTTLFGTGVLQVNLSTSTNEESRPALTPDEKIFVMSTDRGSDNGQFNILISTRSDPSQSFGTPDGTHMAKVNDPALGSHYDPFLSADGLRLYFAPTMPGMQHIVMSSRPDLNSDFSTAATLNAINDLKHNNADPAPSLDEKIIVFSTDRQGNNDLWYATRSDPTQDFGAPMVIPTVNGPAADGDPMLSADGCTLYFSSTRDGTYDLYAATVIH